jgi:hypothetical protein
MAWTTPVTWATNQLVAAGDLNAQIRDNENYLLTPGYGAVNRQGASDYSLTVAPPGYPSIRPIWPSLF